LDKINAYELTVGCFSRVESVKIGKFPNGTYIVRYVYRHEPNVHGDQIIWLLYNRKSMKRIKAILNYIRNCLEAWNGKILLIDDFDSSRPDIAVEVSMLSDGRGTWHAFQIHHVKGGVGNVGVIVGQGRCLDLNDDAMLGCIHVLLANALKKLARKDRFIAAGLEKLRLLEEKARSLGLKPRHVTVDSYGRVKK